MTFRTTVRGPNGPIEGAFVQVNDEMTGLSFCRSTDGGGYADVSMPGAKVGDRVTIVVFANGYDMRVMGDAFEVTAADHDLAVELVPSFRKPGRPDGGRAGDVDPSSIPLEQLARIRGAMWTVPGPWAYGPRPGQPDNITALEFIGSYPPDVQLEMIAHYKSFGYTHCCIGPINAQSYHGAYPDRDFTGAEFEAFLDLLQMFWNHGLAPIVFLHPDNWTLEETQALYDPLIRGNARAQRLMRIICPSGWEPTKYDWSSHTWAAYMQWGHALLPNALILLHTVSDVDAPVGTDARGDDNGKPNAEGWQRVAPHIHGWLVQSSAFANPDEAGDRNHPNRTNFQNWQDLFNPSVRGSYPDRFRHGYAGWPTTSLWGNAPIKVIAAEFCSYWVYWEGRTYAEGCRWGDAAIRAGADGVLDGCTIDVP